MYTLNDFQTNRIALQQQSGAYIHIISHFSEPLLDFSLTRHIKNKKYPNGVYGVSFHFVFSHIKLNI